MSFHGYDLITDWRNSQCGKIARAKKADKEYFLKKYQTPVAPIDNGTLDRRTFIHNQELFDEFVSRRKSINQTIRKITGPGGNIVIPCDEFIDGNQYVEASELVAGAIDEDELDGVLASLTPDVKKLLMATAAGALASVHSKKIVHSDLKPKNVLLVRNGSGNYVAKLIDFDSSYFVNNKPDEIVGTIDYYSPELGAYADAEDEADEMSKRITEKSDIFSLGLLFHYYLSGELPKPISLTERLRKRQEKGKVIYCWIALNSGCDLELSSEIKSIKYRSLIQDMLSLKPEDRPSASEVLKRLKEDEKDPEPVIIEPWPEHLIVLNKDKMINAGVLRLDKVSESGQKKYKLLLTNGKKIVLSKDEMLSKGYASVVAPSGFCDPWSVHDIEFDIDRIKSRGFVSCEQNEKNGLKGYLFYRADSSNHFFSVENLLSMKYAKKKERTVSEPTGIDSPWPEHNICFIVEAIIARGFIDVKREIKNGIKGYCFTKSGGISQFLRVEMVIVQKMAKKI